MVDLASIPTFEKDFTCSMVLIINSYFGKCCRHNKALSHLDDDVDELNFRVKGANQRARRLVGK